MAVNDEALVAGMATGDTQATATLVRRYQARVYGLALTIVGVSATAEDVAQETFLRAWRFAGGYDPRRGAVLTWLLTITRNAALNAIRLDRDRPLQPEAMMAVLVARQSNGHSTGYATGGEPTDHIADHVAEVERIRDALRELPTEQATAVVMATYYGLTAREIAEQLGLPLGTAKTRIRLGLARLRDSLEVSDD